MTRLPDLNIRQGATLPLVVEDDDATADTATITIKVDIDSVVAFTKTANFADGSADLALTASETLALPAGDYIYQLTIAYSDGVVDKYPDPEDSGCADGECDFPTLTICEALDSGVS